MSRISRQRAQELSNHSPTPSIHQQLQVSNLSVDVFYKVAHKINQLILLILITVKVRQHERDVVAWQRHSPALSQCTP